MGADDDDDRGDSLAPHIYAIAKSKRTRRAAWSILRWLVPIVMGGLVVPAWQTVSGWLHQVRQDHIDFGVAKAHLTVLENAKTATDRDSAAEANEVRHAIVASVRAHVEFVAGSRHMDVQSVLNDYDNQVFNWKDRSPKCLVREQCPVPTEAARMALSARKNR